MTVLWVVGNWTGISVSVNLIVSVHSTLATGAWYLSSHTQNITSYQSFLQFSFELMAHKRKVLMEHLNMYFCMYKY